MERPNGWFHELKQLVSQIHESQGLEPLQAALERLRSILGYTLAAIYLPGPDAHTAVLRFYSGPGSSDGGLPPCISVMAEIFTGERAGVTTDGDHALLPRSLREFLHSSGYPHLCLIPIRSGKIPVGLLLLCASDSRQLNSDEQDLLHIMSLEIGDAYMRDLLQKRLLAAVNRAESTREEGDLYLDIMTHDLNNMNNSLLGYIHLISETSSGEARGYAERAEAILRQAIETIERVSTIREIRESRVRLHKMELDPVIADVARAFPEARIDYRETGMAILADELLPQIFLNLIGNSQKFGGRGVNIAIRAERSGEEVLLEVEDTGPGIPDELASSLFQRSARGSTPLGGKGLGLYIVRLLAERYGGSVQVVRRVGGDPGSGTVVRLVLRAAPSG